jgi:antirestriction protein
MNQNKEKHSQDVLDRIKKSFLSQEIIEAYSEGMGYPVTVKLIEDAEEAYAGKYNTEKEFSENLLIEIGIADTMEDWLFYCLDFESVWQEIRHDYFYVSKNEEKHFFRHL